MMSPRLPIPLQSAPRRAAVYALACVALTLGLGGRHAQAESQTALTAAVEGFVAQVLEPIADAGGAPATISVGAPRNDRLGECDDPAPFLPPGARLRSGMNVGVRCTVPNVWTTYVPVSIQMDVTYFVAARTVAADQSIGPDDIEARQVDLSRLPAHAVRQATDLHGMVATNRVNVGAAFKTSALRSPLSVVRGQNVRIVANGKGFSVTSEGQAMATAGPGTTVQVRTKSGQLVSGVVRHAGLVEITL